LSRSQSEAIWIRVGDVELSGWMKELDESTITSIGNSLHFIDFVRVRRVSELYPKTGWWRHFWDVNEHFPEESLLSTPCVNYRKQKNHCRKFLKFKKCGQKRLLTKWRATERRD
jgi:hypothetical protein